MTKHISQRLIALSHLRVNLLGKKLLCIKTAMDTSLSNYKDVLFNWIGGLAKKSLIISTTGT